MDIGGSGGFHRLKILYGLRNYRIYMIGDFVSLIGNWAQRVAIGWLTWQLTGSVTWLGIIGFADLFPSVAMAPLGGVIADRGDPRSISFTTQVWQTVQTVALCVLSFTDWMNIWLLLLLTVARGTLAAINQPARLALVPSLLPREHLPAGLAVNSLGFNLARFVGPAVAGVAIPIGGVGLAFGLNALSYLVLLYALWVLDLPKVVRSHVARGFRNTLMQAREGVDYVRRSAALAPILFLFTVAALCARPIQELLPGFADEVFARGASGLAWMTSAMGLGAMLGGYFIIRAGSYTGLTSILFVNYAVMGGALLVFAWTTLFWLALLILAVLGFAMAVNSICTQSIMQNAVEDAYRGRVMSLYGMVFRGFPAIGALVIGVAADLVGLAIPLATAAILTLVAWLPSLRHRPQPAAVPEVAKTSKERN